jgi:phosphoserine phosphatase
VSAQRPLVIDLDGTLINTDLLLESALRLLKKEPLSLLRMLGWLLRGKAHLKRMIASKVDIDVRVLPYNQALLGWIGEERAKGRNVILATAATERLATAVAGHVGLFDEVLASDGRVNLSGRNKCRALVERFGEAGFDYAANHRDDVVIWQAAHTAILVNAPANLARRLGAARLG